MAFEIGANIGPYRITEKLGRGGMATVYKAYHANLDRYVALKVLHPAFLEDPNFLARFQREARLVAKLEHTNIVPVYDFSEHDEQPYLVMKYIEGETLKAQLMRGRLSVEQIWKVIDAVGAGLSHAHDEGILHRDIKPSNVIMAKDGKAYLADFGLARIAQTGESTLTSDMIMGTPQYISPEQAKGESDLDNRTDIYSFAVMLYEMVVGKVPFSSDTPFSIIHDHIYSPLPLPHLVNPNVPDEVERVLLKALSKEREDRYESVDALNVAFKKAWDEADIDMAEATITTPIKYVPMPPPAEFLEKPKTSTPIPEKEAKTKKIAQQKKTKIAEKKPKKKSVIWIFAALGVLLCIVACFVFGTPMIDNLFARFSDAEYERVMENSEDAPLPPVEEDAPPPPPIGEEIPLGIEDAQHWAEENPDDPYANLELAIAILEHTPENREAFSQALRKASSIAGDDAQFFIDAGYAFVDHEAWGASTAMFLRVMELNKKEGIKSGEDVIYLFHESVYKAAIRPDFFEQVQRERFAKIDESMMLVAEARHVFYNGNREEALNILNEAKKLRPKFPEAILLEGEMHAQAERYDKARESFEFILTNENIIVADWIFMAAEDALAKLP